MRRKTLAAIGGTLLLLFSAGPVRAEETLDVEALIQEALSNNPAVAAVAKNTEALWERPSQARAWDDPRLSFGVSNLPVDDFDFNKQDMTQKVLSLSQNVPFFGITALREKAAVEEARGADQDLEQTRLSITRDVKRVYYELYYNNESLKITEANRDILEQFVDFARTKYEAGMGLQDDVLKAQVALYKMQEKLIELRQQGQTLQAGMNRLLSRDDDAPLGGEPAVRLDALDLSQKELEETALAHNPRLLALQHVIEARQARYGLAKKQYFPQFSLTASYGQRDNRRRAKAAPTRVIASDGTFNDVQVLPLAADRDRPDFFSFMVGMNIPLWFKSKQGKAVSENFHRVAQAQAQYEGLRDDVRFAVRDLSARIAKGRRLAKLYHDSIIPRARQTLEANMAAYQVDKIDFLTLLDSQISLFDFEKFYHKIISEYERDLAELELTAGRRLF